MSKSYKQLDLYFAGFIVPPSETFADTMRLKHGWTTPGPEQQEKAPYLSARDGVIEHIEAMQAFVVMTVEHFGLGSEAPTEAQVNEYVGDYDNQSAVGVFTFTDYVATVALNYLRGEGDCYRTLGNLANRDGYDIFV